MCDRSGLTDQYEGGLKPEWRICHYLDMFIIQKRTISQIFNWRKFNWVEVEEWLQVNKFGDTSTFHFTYSSELMKRIKPFSTREEAENKIDQLKRGAEFHYY